MAWGRVTDKQSDLGKRSEDSGEKAKSQLAAAPSVTILQGHVLDKLKELPDQSIQCVVTSPPYFGLRDYSRCECATKGAWEGSGHNYGLQLPHDVDQGGSFRKTEPDPICPKCHGTGKDDSLTVVWDAVEGCEHKWGEEIISSSKSGWDTFADYRTDGGAGNRKIGGLGENANRGSYCRLCEAWRGQLGLEPTPDFYVKHIVQVFREVRRVLREDGVLFLNLGDSYIGSSAHPMLKQKDMVGMPWMVAKAMQVPFYTGRILNEGERIWLAAMIEAEGCMFIHRRKVGQSNGQGYVRKHDSYGAGLEVANVNREIVERCLSIAKTGSICDQAPSQNFRRKQRIYRWNLRTNECRDIIREIYPHLVSESKRHQARLLLSCPSSGEDAEKAWRSVKNLHNGLAADIDFKEPESLFEPGWYLRSDIIFSKPNPMPESVTDRPTKAHEYVFLMTKSARYFYDAEAIKEPAIYFDDDRKSRAKDGHQSAPTGERNGIRPVHKDARSYDGKHSDKQRGHSRRHAGFNDRWDSMSKTEQCSAMRNKRTVWTIATQPFRGAELLADYVGADGKPYKRSADCPMHGPRLVIRIEQRDEG